MAVGDDMNTLATAGDAIVDNFLGGHADTDLVKVGVSKLKTAIAGNDIGLLRLLFGLVMELINKVYDLENP